jgi:hypothetical protein
MTQATKKTQMTRAIKKTLMTRATKKTQMARATTMQLFKDAFEAFKLLPPPAGSSLFSAAIYSPAFDRMRTFAVRSAESRRAVDLTSRMYDDMFATYRSKPANCISDVYCRILLDHSFYFE